MMDWQAYRQSLACTVKRGDHPALALLLIGFPVWQGVVRTGRLLDHAVAPEHRDQPVTAPVFIVGHQRSGTTLLHRLLSLDPRFSAPLAWQLALPAVSLYRSVERIRRLGVGKGAVRRLEERLFSGFSTVHETRWEVPEEDDWLFLHAAASPTLDYLTADPQITDRYWLGDDLPDAVRHRAMHWYRRSLQRHLYATDPTATLLSKNPHFTGWMNTLNLTFPDARFVWMHRDPAQAIASRLSMLRDAWHRTAPVQGRRDPRIHLAFQTSCALYRRAEAVWPTLPAGRRWRVEFDDLVADPDRAVRALYAHFGWSVPEALRRGLAGVQEEADHRVPQVTAKLRHFGIRPDDLAEAMS